MNCLFVKAEKCEFHASSVSFLCFIVRQGQLSPNPARDQAVAERPNPSTRKQLQQFLGFANFDRRFIHDYSKVAAPLTKLPSTLRSFAWDDKEEAAFARLKVLFTTAPVFSHPDPAHQFTVEVDTSDTGVGAVLSKRNPTDQQLHPAHSSAVVFRQQNGTTTLATVSCWPWCQHCRSGVTRLKDQLSHLWYGRTTGTCSIYVA